MPIFKESIHSLCKVIIYFRETLYRPSPTCTFMLHQHLHWNDFLYQVVFLQFICLQIKLQLKFVLWLKLCIKSNTIFYIFRHNFLIFRIILSTDFFSSQLYDGKKHVNGLWIYSINLLYVWQYLKLGTFNCY